MMNVSNVMSNMANSQALSEQAFSQARNVTNPQALSEQAFGNMGNMPGGHAGCGGGGMGSRGPAETSGEMARPQPMPEDSRSPKADSASGGSGAGAKGPADFAEQFDRLQRMPEESRSPKADSTSSASGAGAQQPGQTTPDPSNMSLEEILANPEFGPAIREAFSSEEVQQAMTEVTDAIVEVGQDLDLDLDLTQSAEELTQDILEQLLSNSDDPRIQEALSNFEAVFRPAFAQALAGGDTASSTTTDSLNFIDSSDLERSFGAFGNVFTPSALEPQARGSFLT